VHDRCQPRARPTAGAAERGPPARAHHGMPTPVRPPRAAFGGARRDYMTPPAQLTVPPWASGLRPGLLRRRVFQRRADALSCAPSARAPREATRRLLQCDTGAAVVANSKRGWAASRTMTADQTRFMDGPAVTDGGRHAHRVVQSRDPVPRRARPRPRAISWLAGWRGHKTPPAQLTVPPWANRGRIGCCCSHQFQKGPCPPRSSAPGSPQTNPPTPIPPASASPRRITPKMAHEACQLARGE